jgi:hypothetical protein
MAASEENLLTRKSGRGREVVAALSGASVYGFKGSGRTAFVERLRRVGDNLRRRGAAH